MTVEELPQPQEITLLVKMFKRRGIGFAISIDDALPEKTRCARPPKNIIKDAVRIRDFFNDNPGTTQDDAVNAFNLSRMRIYQLMKIANNLPAGFIDRMVTCENQTMLSIFSGAKLLKIADCEIMENRQEMIDKLLEV
ncbi:MAG: hypothetical protein ABIH47_07255 [Candidatus Omnitrophota bacterium]